MSRWRGYGVYIVLGMCMAVLLSSCYTPPPIPAVRTPIPVPLHELLLDPNELKRLSYYSLWQPTESFNVLDEWYLSNAIAAMEVRYGSVSPMTLTYTIVQYGDSTGAESTWREFRDSSVIPRFSGEEIDVLDMEQLPPLHADNVWLRCEHHSRVSSELLKYVDKDCVARLQYDVLYVQFQTTISQTRSSIDVFSPEQFYEILQMVDDKMRPIWQGNILSTPDTAHSSKVRYFGAG